MLTYHAISSPPRGTTYRGIFYESRNFARQLAELRAAGFKSTPPSGAIEKIVGGDGNPDRKITLTFDDGYRSVVEAALPVLKETGFSATVFLVADRLGGSNDWDACEGVVSTSLMDVAQVREWIAAGNRIGSHTLSHPHLQRIPLTRAREEIQSSKRKLEDLFGTAVEDFCYPYGHYNEAVVELVREAGYLTACTTRFGLNQSTSPALELNRLIVRRPVRSLKTFKAWLRRLWRR